MTAAVAAGPATLRGGIELDRIPVPLMHEVSLTAEIGIEHTGGKLVLSRRGVDACKQASDGRSACS